MNRNRMELSKIVVKAIQTEHASVAAAVRSIDFSSFKRDSHEIYQLSPVTHRTVKIMMLMPSTIYKYIQTYNTHTQSQQKKNALINRN